MAKKAVKKPASGGTARSAKAPQRQAKTAPKRKPQARRSTAREPNVTAADALIGLLESPLVADILAAGAAAALATMAQRGFSRRQDGSTKAALKNAAAAAATAMGARISTELDEILKSSKRARGEAS